MVWLRPGARPLLSAVFSISAYRKKVCSVLCQKKGNSVLSKTPWSPRIKYSFAFWKRADMIEPAETCTQAYPVWGNCNCTFRDFHDFTSAEQEHQPVTRGEKKQLSHPTQEKCLLIEFHTQWFSTWKWEAFTSCNDFPQRRVYFTDVLIMEIYIKSSKHQTCPVTFLYTVLYVNKALPNMFHSSSYLLNNKSSTMYLQPFGKT